MLALVDPLCPWYQGTNSHGRCKCTRSTSQLSTTVAMQLHVHLRTNLIYTHVQHVVASYDMHACLVGIILHVEPYYILPFSSRSSLIMYLITTFFWIRCGTSTICRQKYFIEGFFTISQRRRPIAILFLLLWNRCV